MKSSLLSLLLLFLLLQYNWAQNISAGADHSLIICESGNASAWGDGFSGELGDGLSQNNSTPVSVFGLNNVIAVSAGLSSFALKSDGTVWAWGPLYSASPGQVLGLTNIISIASGFGHCLALKSDGTVWAWGINTSGQLGDGTDTFRTTAVQVSGSNNIVAITAGARHSLALKSDGTVWTWGENSFGQLGNDTTISSRFMVNVTGLTGVVAIGAGYVHSFAVKSDGTLWAWGGNFNFQLGDSTNINRHHPVEIRAIDSVVLVDGGEGHSIAIRADGTVWTWGSQSYGVLGHGSNYSHDSIPVLVSTLSDIVAISAGEYYCMALKSDGTVWTWGYNLRGQLGNGTFSSSGCCCVATPAQVTNLCSVTLMTKEISNSANDLVSYPNPSNGNFTITFKQAMHDGILKIFDTIGKQVYSIGVNGSEAFVDCKLEEGMYFMQVTDSKRQCAKMIIVE